MVAAAAVSTAATSPPPSAAAFAAVTAGVSASTMVLSPDSALPRATTPSRAAVSAVTNTAASTVSAVPSDVDARRNAVPNSGPAAPPTVEISVVATILSTAPGVAGAAAASRASSLVNTAENPRAKFSPWSPSQMSRSRWVSSTLCSATVAATARIAATVPAASQVIESHAPTQRDRVHRGIPELGHLVVQFQQGDRHALHLQRGDVVADQRPGHLDTPLGQVLPRGMVGEVQLDRRSAPHAVDEQQGVVAGGERQILDDGTQQRCDDLVGGGQLHPFPAGLAVDPDTHLHLVVGQRERRLARVRHRARG